MISSNVFKKIVFSFPEVTEHPHFEIISFKVNKKIFVTFNLKEGRATVLLPSNEQDLFCVYDKNVMYPVLNKWGTYGWKHIIPS